MNIGSKIGEKSRSGWQIEIRDDTTVMTALSNRPENRFGGAGSRSPFAETGDNLLQPGDLRLSGFSVIE